jgi:hypothetical protein|uniref:Uncharacterized protein n=1 Tax=Zea mays TaxID=4577 RepID=A0A804NK40_MAIZE
MLGTVYIYIVVLLQKHLLKRGRKTNDKPTGCIGKDRHGRYREFSLCNWERLCMTKGTREIWPESSLLIVWLYDYKYTCKS